jgi:hypothetical protein
MSILASLLSHMARKPHTQASRLHEARVCFFNHSSLPRIICVEPWGADYTLAENERFELVVGCDQSEPTFELMNDDKNTTQVWCEAETFEVIQAGKVLECGHNRGLVR